MDPSTMNRSNLSAGLEHPHIAFGDRLVALGGSVMHDGLFIANTAAACSTSFNTIKGLPRVLAVGTAWALMHGLEAFIKGPEQRAN